MDELEMIIRQNYKRFFGVAGVKDMVLKGLDYFEVHIENVPYPYESSQVTFAQLRRGDETRCLTMGYGGICLPMEQSHYMILLTYHECQEGCRQEGTIKEFDA